MMILSLDDIHIPLRIEKARGRTMNFGFAGHEPVLVIRTPSGKLNTAHRNALNQHKAWILKGYQQKQKVWARRQEFHKRMAAGKINYLGKERRFVFVEGDRKEVFFRQGHIAISVGRNKAGGKLELLQAAMKELAKRYITARTESLARKTQSKFNNITVKKVKTKWGSCSSKRNLNFNWHLVFLPPHLIDYIIIHELMHLREMNHGHKFWKWVHTFYPDYKQAEKEIGDYEWLISIFEDQEIPPPTS